MKDLDFDEIDRAVSSIATNTSASDDKTNLNQGPVPNTSDISQSSTADTTSPLSPATARSTGKFMDVVHPSSNTNRSSLIMPERVNNQVPPNNTPPPNTETTPVTTQTNNVQTAPVNLVDANNKVIENTTNLGQDQNEDDDINQISDEINSSLSQTNNDSHESPFISGTKVEKRPLGAFSNDLSPQTSQQSDNIVDSPSDKVDSSDDGSLEKIKTPLPAELGDDLLKIESDNLVIAKGDSPKPPDEAKLTPDKVKIEGPTDIAQQYKEKPSSGDQKTGAIYDTDSYHKGLINPVKKKSGWMWIVWISLLVVVGTGVGAALYFFFTPYL